MAKKIATAEAVFRACEELDAAGSPWNRDDVRYRVGGGGFNVIDPLIQAWRRLKPVKAIAPSTPTELLHLIAASVEQHFTDYIKQMSENAEAREKAFDRASADLSEVIETLNGQVSSLTQAQQENDAHIERLMDQKADILEDLNTLKAQYSALQDEKDKLQGQVHRLEQHAEVQSKDHEHKHNTLLDKHRADLREREAKHKQELAQQNQASREAQEASENRLMRLLDQERREHKVQVSAKHKDIQALKEQVQDQQQQLLDLHKALAQKDEKISALTAEKQALLQDGRQTDTLAEIQAAIKGLQNQFSAETS
jgi:DNA repair exonuclease SbcCD ATPase subunit